MKKLLFLLTLLPHLAFALESNQLNINAGVGFAGTRGLVGVSAERFITKNHALSVSTGIDLAGFTMSAGYKYFMDPMAKSGTFFDNCFLFLFKCEVHPYAGAVFQHANGTTTKFITESQTREYKTSSQTLGLVVVGFREIFTSNITFDLELSYRSRLSGGKTTHVSGEYREDDVERISKTANTVGFGLAVGYLF